MELAVDTNSINKFVLNGFVRSCLLQECCTRNVTMGTNATTTRLTIVPSVAGVLAGSPFLDSLFKEYDCSPEWHVPEGQNFTAKCKVLSVTGRRYDLLCCERLATSILSRASGIASQTKKLRRLLTELSWKGKLLVTPLLTPGFGAVEEYAMIIGGAESSSSLAYLRQSQISLLGDIDNAVKSARSKNPTAKIAIECCTLADAMAASVAGADVVVFLSVKLKDFSSVVSQVKKSHPAVQTCVFDALDESNLRAAALSTVDLIATTKLINGYELIEFQANCESPTVLESPTAAEENSRSSSPEIIDEHSSSATPSATKRPRLNEEEDSVDSVQSTPPPSTTTAAASKPNGVLNRGSAASQTGVDTISSSVSRTSVGSPMRKAQRNHRMLLPQPGSTPRRPSPLSHRGPLGTAPVRSMSPGVLQMRPPANMAANSLMGNNPHQGGLMVPTSNPYPQPRMPGQSSTPRHAAGGGPAPGMLGNGPNLVANFLGLQTSGSQPGGGGMHPNRQSMALTGGPIMGGVSGGVGMRFWGQGNFSNCRQCGVPNPPGQNCCRNCRTPLR